VYQRPVHDAIAQKNYFEPGKIFLVLIGRFSACKGVQNQIKHAACGRDLIEQR
jgi:hypothetical protein